MISQNSLAYFTVWLLFQLLVDCRITSFNSEQPEQRIYHTTTYIGNKLYILGGMSLLHKDPLNDFFYLDVPGKFNTKTLSWHDLSNNTIPSHKGATTVVGGVNNNILFLYGGIPAANTTMALVYTYDPKSAIWSTPNITGNYTVRKQNLTGIINNERKMYLWGGLNVATSDDMNDMAILDTILDTINFSFFNGSSTNVPSARHSYGAVLLPNQTIIYFGGYSKSEKELPLSEIYLYDTNNNTWQVKKAKGKQISNRYGFSAVLGLDNQRIIIFGGIDTAPLTNDNSLYVLNLTNCEWYKPKSSGKKPRQPRMYHKANVIEKYMVISFGKGYNQKTENDILLLDISNNSKYIWTHDFDLSPKIPSLSSIPPLQTQTKSPISGLVSSPTQTDEINTSVNNSGNRPNNKPKKSVIVGSIIGSLLGVVLLISGGVFLRKWREKNKIQINTVAIDHF